ncbi:hypothetical protein [Sphingomonas oryzagri]
MGLASASEPSTHPDSPKESLLGLCNKAHLHENPDIADALESDQFKQFLDQVPVAIAVSELRQPEEIVYADLEFERLSACTSAEIVGQPWSSLPGARDADGRSFSLDEAIARAAARE